MPIVRGFVPLLKFHGISERGKIRRHCCRRYAYITEESLDVDNMTKQ